MEYIPLANKTGAIRAHTCAEEILQVLRIHTLLPNFPHAIDAKQVRSCVGEVAPMAREVMWEEPILRMRIFK
ncbi:hypothetical protein XELAEV_18038468mg [Xenopus laevis]|uniref:Uncharacterized protein n=1 Tax=Xenopus laevis TaxID=8355 RepID=A0A974H7H7_XENLA|nr:hypothetical protein XELAEV_18038468mg [Xenopus laevis]